VFESVVTIIFQSTFRLEMHQNSIFFYKNILFLTSSYQNDPKNFKNHFKKKIIFLEMSFGTQFQTAPY